MKKLFVVVLMLFANHSYAWVQATGATIKHFVQWETPNSTGYIVFMLDDANSTACYVPLNEKELYTAVLAFYMAGKKVNVHCHDPSENKGTYQSHKLHRINAF